MTQLEPKYTVVSGDYIDDAVTKLLRAGWVLYGPRTTDLYTINVYPTGKETRALHAQSLTYGVPPKETP